MMRTPLDNADEVLPTARELAQGAADPPVNEPRGTATLKTIAPSASGRLAAFGIDPLPPRGGVVSNELINQLRDDENI